MARDVELMLAFGAALVSLGMVVLGLLLRQVMSR